MKVYCTRPRQLDEAPHLTEIPIDDLSEYHQCDVCKMPLIFANRYVPIAELGRGGFGYTFKAVDLNFRAEDGNYSYRTIKQFRTEQLLLPNQIERARIAFKEECNILDRLEHPQIPRVYHPFEIASPIYLRSTIRQEPSIYYYFVQKYIEGHDLKDCLNGRRNRVNIDVIKNLNYPLVADLRVFIRADDSVKRKVGEAYITMLMTKEGQRRIKDTGYLPIRE